MISPDLFFPNRKRATKPPWIIHTEYRQTYQGTKRTRHLRVVLIRKLHLLAYSTVIILHNYSLGIILLAGIFSVTAVTPRIRTGWCGFACFALLCFIIKGRSTLDTTSFYFVGLWFWHSTNNGARIDGSCKSTHFFATTAYIVNKLFERTVVAVFPDVCGLIYVFLFR